VLFYLKFYKRGVDWTFLATNGLKSPQSIVGGGGGGGGGGLLKVTNARYGEGVLN
jgi:hypothetical protein